MIINIQREVKNAKENIVIQLINTEQNKELLKTAVTHKSYAYERTGEDVSKYNGGTQIIKGELGRIHGVRFVDTSNSDFKKAKSNRLGGCFLLSMMPRLLCPLSQALLLFCQAPRVLLSASLVAVSRGR